MRRPQEARAEYEAVLQAEPSNRDAAIGRFYAAVEMEDFATAYAQADALLEKEPVWRGYGGDPGRHANDDYVDALLRAALARSYGDQPKEAWTRIAPERGAAPANPFILVAAASIMSARGWPRAAEEENRIALSLAPSFLSAQIGVAESALARSRFEEARTRTQELSGIYPEQRTAQRLAEDLDAETGWQIEADIRPSNERGGGEFGNSGNELTSASWSTRRLSPRAGACLAAMPIRTPIPPKVSWIARPCPAARSWCCRMSRLVPPSPRPPAACRAPDLRARPTGCPATR